MASKNIMDNKSFRREIITLVGLTEASKKALQGSILLKTSGGGQLYVPSDGSLYTLQSLNNNFRGYDLTGTEITVNSRSQGKNVMLTRIDLPEDAAASIKDGIDKNRIKFASTHPINGDVDAQLSNIIDKRARHQNRN